MAKIERMLKKISRESGIPQEEVFAHAGECMEEDDVLFTDGDLYCAMRDVYLEAEDAFKGNPEAVATLRKHFEIK